jgi:TusE/DsrC/DsvC family sulfur relay protein
MAENKERSFPNAPADWSEKDAIEVAKQEKLELGEDHWEMVRALQEYFARHADAPMINKRELHDALEEKFHIKGGLRYLYKIFPGGPVAQGCRLAGLQVPEGAVDKAFGSVS